MSATAVTDTLPPTIPPRRDGTLAIEAPLAVASPADVAWDETVDVLVAGFGSAGAAAAIAAHEAGVRPLIVDRFEGGGATRRSGGIVYAGGGTRHQRGFGYEDTPEQMYRYLKLECGDAVSETTLRRFCNESRGLLEWLESLGASFESSVEPPKTSYPRDGTFLYFSGNESVPSYAAVAEPAPRGHRVRADGMSGIRLFEILKAKVDALGIPVRTQCAVRRLVVDERSGEVIGAEVRALPAGSAAAKMHEKLRRRADRLHHFSSARSDRARAQMVEIENASGETRRIRSPGGVVLATGGFIFNREMVARHAPKYVRTHRLGSTGCDGSGIRLGESVGGVPARMNKVSAWRFINPPTRWPEGIVVNDEGERFCNEQVYGAKLGVEMCEHHDGRGWLILDRELRRSAMKEALFGGLWFFQAVPSFIAMLFAKRAKTIAELAQNIGVPRAALEETVRCYNAAAASGGQDALGKSPELLHTLGEGPFYALDISAASRKSPCPAITLGGLRVDERTGHVQDGRGRTIGGLYAAGRAAVGIASNGYVSGLSLADCLWSGRRAGRAAAQTLKMDQLPAVASA